VICKCIDILNTQVVSLPLALFAALVLIYKIRIR
jgi:hypothetical protein